LSDLQKRKTTNAQAAELLGVSETYLSRKVAAMQAKVPGTALQKRAAASTLYNTRRVFREQLAKKAAKGKMTVAEAAAEAECSERTMFRYVARYRA
jgi:predicted DNA-binding transcriptional regulator YafY